MMTIDAKTAEVLATITDEQWEAILTIAEKMTTETQEKVGDLYLVVTDILKKIGVPPHILGYGYLREAIILAYENETYIHKVTTELYPRIAKKFNTTSSKVERAIRHAIQRAFDNGESYVRNEIFEGCYPSSKARPENANAIAILVEYIKLQE